MKKYLVFLLCIIFFVGCEKEISTSPENLDPTNSSVVVNSVPSDMKIFKDGFYIGKNTPAEINRLELGSYLITLKKDLYRDTTFLLNISDDFKIELTIDLHKNPRMLGSLLCESIPNNSQIVLNDSLTEFKTPYTFRNLIPGTYTVKYLFPNFKGLTNNFVVRSNSQTRSFMNLTDTSVWVPYFKNDFDLLEKNLTTISSRSDGILLIGTLGSGLLKFENHSFSHINSDFQSFSSNKIYDIYSYQNESWIAAENDIYKFDGNSFTAYSANTANFPNDIITSIDGNNSEIWFGFKSSGIAKYNVSSFTFYNESTSSLIKNVNDISVDDNNNVWIGTSDNGLVKYDGINFVQITDIIELGLDIQTVENYGNEIWVTHRPKSGSIGGISYFNGTEWIKFTSLINRNYVSDFYIDKNNKKYLSTPDGLYIFQNPNSIQLFDKSNSPLSVNLINAAVTNSKNEIWIVTDGGGLYKFKNN